MKLVNGRAYPGTRKGKFYTLKQMWNFFRRSKKLNREYWLARIDEFKVEKIKFQSLFKKKGVKND